MSRKLALSVGATCVGALLLLGAPGPSGAQDDVGPADSLTPSDVSLTLGIGASATVSDTLHLAAAPPKADIVIAVDTTASMGGAITDARADAVAIVQRIGASIPGARFAVVDFKDYPVAPFGGTGDYPYLLRSGFTTESAQIQAAVDAMTASGGGDLPEAFNRVVYESYSDPHLGRDTSAPAFVVFLGDDLPHDAAQNSTFSSCPNTPPTDLGRDGAASADDLTTKAVLDGAKANHVNVSIVVYNPRPTVTSCWSQLSPYTGGQQVTRAGTTSVADQIVALVDADAARIDEVTFTASPASFNSWISFTPPPPYGPFTAPIDAQFEETITVPAGTAEGDYTFQVQALADGAIRATQSVTVHVRKQAVTGLQLTSDQRSLPSGLAAVPFTSIPASLIPAFAGNAASTPGGSIPGGSIPGGSIPGGSIPGGSIPGGSITFGSLGLGAIPGGSIPGGSIPGGSIPGGSIGVQTALRSVLLSQIPLTNPASGATWAQVLAPPSTLTGRPLSTLTLLDVAADATAWGRLKALPWRDVPLATTRWGGVPLAAWLLGNATLSQLPVPGGHSTWAQALEAAGGSATGLDATTNTVFGVGIAGQLGQTDIGSIPGGSIPGGSIPGGSIPAREILLSSIRIAATRLATVALADISPVGDIVNCGPSFACTGKNLGDADAAAAIKPSATFGMLLDRLPAGHSARQMTVSELIFGFLAMSQYPFEQLDGQGLQEFSGTGQNATYHVDFEFDCSIASSFTIGVGLPRGEFPVKGSTTFSFAGGAPVAGANPTSLDKAGETWTARWTSIPAGACGTGMRHVRMSFQAYERLNLGEHTAGVSVTANGTYAVTQQAPIEVTQRREPDGTPSQATPIQKDTLYFGHIGYAGDLDAYRLPLDGLAPGTKVAAFLNVPGDADFDVVLRKPDAPSVRSTPGGSIPGGSIPIESLAPHVDNDERPLPPDTLADIPVSTPGGSIPGGSIPGGSIPGGSIPGGSISANRGAATEAAQIVTAGEAGDALIDVSGYLGSHSGQPYVLRVQVTPPPPLPTCLPITGRSSAAPGELPSLAAIPAAEKPLYKTLFLINRQRMVALYGQSEVDTLLNSPASPLNVAAARPEVKGLVLPVDGDEAVRTAFAVWDDTPCSISAVNGVVRKINDLTDGYKAALPNIEYVVLLGPDPALPSWRQYDRAQISPEVDEAGELVEFTNDLADPNPLYASAAQNHFLVDGAYGARKKISWLGSDLPLPQDSVSRLLESPGQIGEWLRQYNETEGILDPQTELTTGDEFFTDSADATHKALLAAFPNISGDTLYPPTSAGWTKNDLLADFFAKSPVPDISALYAHYNPWLAQPAGPIPITSLNELVSTASLPGGDALEGKVVFTIGCHSGLNVPDIYPGDVAKKNDWAQAYRGAVYVANTGFGYDDTESIALSGRLMSLFAQKLNRGTGSIGEQWVNAVNTYHVTAGNWDVLDEKVMLQATMYGPPWARFRTPVNPPTIVPPTTHTDGSLEVATVAMSPTITHNDLPDGRSWWDVDGQTLSVEHRSIQPLATRDVTIPGKRARDPFITSLTVNDLADKKPVRAFPTIRSSLYEPNPNFRNIWWPAIPVTVLESAFGSQLNLIAGQFRPSAEGSELGTERLINSISVDIAYSSNGDVVRPLITDAGAVMTGPASARLFVRVTDESGQLTKVAALYNDGVNNFKFKRLELVSGDLWTADVSGLAGPPEVIAQTRDGAGNVGFSANKAVNFTALTDGTPPEIAIASPLAGAVFTIGQLIPADYNCSDDGGVESCDGDVAKGANVDTASAGPKTFTVTAEDLSGNPASKAVSYSVRYGFLGFFQPVDNLPVLNSVKAGTTVPVKWKLQTATGQEITTLEAVTSVTSKPIKCPTAATDPVESTVPAALTPLKYDPVVKQYVYTWTTAKAWAGTCREVFVGFRDGTYKSARFQLK